MQCRRLHLHWRIRDSAGRVLIKLLLRPLQQAVQSGAVCILLPWSAVGGPFTAGPWVLKRLEEREI